MILTHFHSPFINNTVNQVQVPYLCCWSHLCDPFSLLLLLLQIIIITITNLNCLHRFDTMQYFGIMVDTKLGCGIPSVWTTTPQSPLQTLGLHYILYTCSLCLSFLPVAVEHWQICSSIVRAVESRWQRAIHVVYMYM